MQLLQEFSSMKNLVKNGESKFIDYSSSEFLHIVHNDILKTIDDYSNELLKEMTLKHFETKGKMLRPLFISELAKALKIYNSNVVDWAVACEILHNATLIHDDLQDGDEVRRGAPTIWKRFGNEQAINIGDFLLVIAPNSLLNNSEINAHLLKLYTQMSSRIVCGQVSEFEFNKLDRSDILYFEKYLSCISGKTSTLFSGLALGVGLIASADDFTLSSLEEVFFSLGHLFQMQDDILDLFGDKERLEQGCDIKEGKFSFLVAKHLDNHPEDFQYLKNILLKSRKATTLEDIKNVKNLFQEKETLNKCVLEVHYRIGEVLKHQYLSDNELFKTLVKELISRVMTPISHIEVK